MDWIKSDKDIKEYFIGALLSGAISDIGAQQFPYIITNDNTYGLDKNSLFMFYAKPQYLPYINRVGVIDSLFPFIVYPHETFYDSAAGTVLTSLNQFILSKSAIISGDIPDNSNARLFKRIRNAISHANYKFVDATDTYPNGSYEFFDEKPNSHSDRITFQIGLSELHEILIKTINTLVIPFIYGNFR
jgi:hypothetical protein